MLELLKTRRSIRRYQDRTIEKDKLDQIIKCALLAPSSRARRPWEFIVVEDKTMLAKLSECREHSSGFLSGAAACIIVAADSEKCDVWIEDASIAASFIQLAAHSVGLGSCWIQVRDRYTKDNQKAENYIKELINLPDNYKVECIIALGYPAEDKKPYEESELLYEKVHYEVYK